MNKVIVLFFAGLIVGCGASEVSETDPVKSETTESLKEVQDLNVELEAIDGELDSLINNLK